VTLARRIRQVGALRDRVAFVWSLPWKSTLSRITQMQKRGTLPKDVFYYFDPPFFEKADRLYTYYFCERDHRRLRDTIVSLNEPWILSYDCETRAAELYAHAARG